MSKKEFMLAVCSHRGTRSETAQAIELLHQMVGNIFLTRYYSGDAWIDRLRSVAATEFLRMDWAEYMIFIDDDIVLLPEHILQIYKDMKDEGYDLIGGGYPTRTGSQLASYGSEELGGIQINGTIQEIKWLATGFMGISKKLLRKMVDELKLPLLHVGQWCENYPFFVFCAHLTPAGNAMLFSEDWEFCEKARSVGVKTYMDTKCIVGHLGDKVYTITDVIENNRQLELKAIQRNGVLNQERAGICLQKTIAVIKKYTTRYWIDSGTLLSAFRDGDFNKYDHDIDVRLFKEDIPDEKMPQLMSDLYSAGYLTLQQNTGNRKQVLALWENEIMLDLKFCEYNKDWLWYHVWDKNPGSSILEESDVTTHVFPIRFYEEMDEIELRGHKYPAPKPIEEYLTYHYGDLWRNFKTKAEDTYITDFKWDAQYSPPCSKTMEQYERLVNGDMQAERNLIKQHLSEFLNMDLEVLNKKISLNISDEMNNDFANSGLTVDQFYRTDNDLILLDLCDFNTNYRYLEWIKAELIDIKGKKILDFGCGLGTISFFLGQENVVTGYDVNKRLIDFCNYRADKLNSAVTFTTELPDEQFDMIIAMDVFEHIPDLKDTLVALSSRLKEGGKLFHRDSFNQKIPVHIDHSDNFDNWLKEVGFTQVSKLLAIKG